MNDTTKFYRDPSTLELLLEYGLMKYVFLAYCGGLVFLYLVNKPTNVDYKDPNTELRINPCTTS